MSVLTAYILSAELKCKRKIIIFTLTLNRSLIVSGTVCEVNYYRVVSSVGLEHYLDRVGVTGSIPVQPTKKTMGSGHNAFFILLIALGPERSAVIKQTV
jgi:hypothetical protein